MCLESCGRFDADHKDDKCFLNSNRHFKTKRLSSKKCAATFENVLLIIKNIVSRLGNKMALYSLPKFKPKNPTISQDEWSSLNKISNIPESIEKLNELIEIPINDINERHLVCSEFHELLKKFYSDCSLHIYGSTVSGFGIKSFCEPEFLFLPFPKYCNSDYAKNEKCSIPDPSSILTGKTSKDVLLEFDEWSHLKFICKVFRGNKSYSKRVYLQHTNPPTLKVHLNKKRMVVNVSSSSKLVVYSSELLQFFGKLDSRVKPLVMTLCFWARSLGFLTKGYFSEYTFTLLVIFFLQNVCPPVLPSVRYLCEISGENRIYAGWETAFTTDVNLCNKSENSATMWSLLTDFFEYYWNFDFVQNIVCPHSGKTLAVKNLSSSKDERMTNFKLSSINIQDPFVLSHNVCKFDCSRNIFKLALLTASQILENIKGGKMTYQTLFDSSEYQKVLELHYDKYLFENPRVCFISLEFELSKKSEYWYASVPKVLFDVLQYGLLMECEIIDKVLWDKKMAAICKNNGFNISHDGTLKLEKLSFKDNPYDLQLLISIQCVIYSRTYIGRKNTTEITVGEEDLKEFSDCNVLKAEYGISRELVKKNPNLTSPDPLLCFQCDLYKHVSPEIDDLMVMLKPLTYKREFYQVSTFLSSYIPKTVKKILLCE